jgi:hypothetical protein
MTPLRQAYIKLKDAEHAAEWNKSEASQEALSKAWAEYEEQLKRLRDPAGTTAS